MPELPEVETIVRSLRPAVVGRRIEAFELLRADFAQPAGFAWASALVGRRVISVNRRAKRLVFELDDGARFYAHLGMTGRLTMGPAGRERAKHTHVCIRFERRSELHFNDSRRFGGLVWLGTGGEPADELGPEPLTLRPARLAGAMARTQRAIKTALLDQRLIAGLGNIYADEALHRARIHPLHPADRLSPDAVRSLNRAIKLTLRRAIEHRGSTLRNYVDAQGRAGAFRTLHRVYDRAGEPCPSCGALITRIVLGGRSTHFCPRCQRRAR